MKMIENMTLKEEQEFTVKLWKKHRASTRIPAKFGVERVKGFAAGVSAVLNKLAEEKVLAEEDAITRAYLEREAEPDGFQHSLGFRLLAAIATGGLLFLFVALPPEREER